MTTRKPKLAQSYNLNEPYIPGRQNYKGIPNATPEMLRKLQQKKIKNPALQQRTRHYHLEHAFGYVLIGVPLFGLMIVVPTFMVGV
jgi:hypothetical protein